MTIKCRFARSGFELGSPDYQEKVLSTTLVRDHQFIVIWVELYVAVRHNTVNKKFKKNVQRPTLEQYLSIDTNTTQLIFCRTLPLKAQSGKNINHTCIALSARNILTVSEILVTWGSFSFCCLRDLQASQIITILSFSRESWDLRELKIYFAKKSDSLSACNSLFKKIINEAHCQPLSLVSNSIPPSFKYLVQID